MPKIVFVYAGEAPMTGADKRRVRRIIRHGETGFIPVVYRHRMHGWKVGSMISTYLGGDLIDERRNEFRRSKV